MNAATMALLLAKGLSGEDLLAVAQAMEADGKPQSKAAIRQARWRAAQKAKEEGENVTSDVTRDVTPPPIESIHTPSSQPNGCSDNEKRARENPFPRPEWADPQHWADFLTNRKRKSLPNTASAYKKFTDAIAAFADDEWPPGRLLEHAAASGWASINDPREARNGRGQNNRASSGASGRVDGFTAALREAGSRTGNADQLERAARTC